MAWNVNQILSFLKWLQNKNQAGSISATDFFYAWNSEQYAYHEDLTGRWQARNNGKTGANTGLIEDETILTKLSPFTLPATIAITSGRGTKPSDFIYALALRINGAKVFYVTHDEIWSINDDVIDPPSISDDAYYCTEYENYYSFLPNTVTTFDLDYLASCSDIVWSYTFDTSGRQQYNANGIQGADVIYGGVGYTTPTIAFSAPALGGVQATGTLTVVGGGITAVVMTNIGYGYAGLTPTATITGSATTPATLGNPIVSVQPKWNQSCVVEITRRALKSFGVHFKDSDFVQFGQSNIQTGD